MPLIILTGIPSSGKSYRAKELENYFISNNKKAIIITENLEIAKAGYQKNDFFSDSQKEKNIRSNLKSEAIRLLNSNDVLILDAGNYIKGYRYEIFCATKAVRITQCTIHCAISHDEAWKFNQNRIKTEQDLSLDVSELNNSSVAYSKEVFDALILRYEEPIGNNRWDSPLFTILPSDELPFENIRCALFDKAPPKPNQSTLNAPLSDTNYLYDMDKITQEVINQIVASRKIGAIGPIKIPNSEIKIDLPTNINAIQLNRLRRSFLNYSKSQTSTGLDKIPNLFIQYLNSNFNN